MLSEFFLCNKTTTWCSISVITLLLQRFAYFWICWGSKQWTLQFNQDNMIVFTNWINWLNERLSSEKLVWILILYLNKDLIEDCAVVMHLNNYIFLEDCSVISFWEGFEVKSVSLICQTCYVNRSNVVLRCIHHMRCFELLKYQKVLSCDIDTSLDD